MSLIDYGPHWLCTKHKHKIPELINCVYCELEDISTLDLADQLKIINLEKERDELKAFKESVYDFTLLALGDHITKHDFFAKVAEKIREMSKREGGE
jgi:hypothetical protein